MQGHSARPLSEQVKDQTSEPQGGQTYVSVGLHACGDLSLLCLQMFVSQSEVRYAFTVPCCYPHLSQQAFPLVGRSARVLRCLSSEYYVQKQYNGVAVPKQLLNYACTGFDEELGAA